MKYKHLTYKFLSLVATSILLVGCLSGEGLQPVNGSSTIDDLVETDVYEMGSGDLMFVDFDSNGDAVVDFSSAEEGSEYYLIIQSYSQSSSSFSVAMANEVAEVVEDVNPYIDEVDQDPIQNFDVMMRQKENLISTSTSYYEVDSDASVNKAAIQQGTTETFRVLASLTSVSSYDEVEAEVYCVGDNVIFYIDEEVAATIPNDFTEADVDELCVNFDEAAQTEFGIYGDASDVNGDGKIAVLMTPAVNRLGAMGGGIITGYFYAGDLYARTLTSNVVSNEREILYTMVPDPDGCFDDDGDDEYCSGVAISHDFAMSNLLPAVLPHELQHAISYNKHVFEYHSSSESSWLNEALSHFTEDMVGYGRENPSRYELYLQNTANYSLVTSSSPGLESRGAAYLFLRYMYEQHPAQEAFLHALVNTDSTGVSNLEEAFAGTSEDFDEFDEFFRRWAVAMALTDTGLTSNASLIYEARTLNTDTGNWQGVCMNCEADDSRGTILTGPAFEEYVPETSITVKGTANRFVHITDVPAAITLNGSSSADLGAVLIRVQ